MTERLLVNFFHAHPVGHAIEALRRLPRAHTSLPDERMLREYFADLLAAHGGDATAIWSIDGVHAAHLG